MKKLIFALCFLLVMTVSLEAKEKKCYLIYDDDTREVVSLIDSDCAVLEAGNTAVTLDDSCKKLGLTRHPVYYLYIDGDFILNNEKISQEHNAEQQGQEEGAEWRKIRTRSLKNACLELEGEGVIFKHIICTAIEPNP